MVFNCKKIIKRAVLALAAVISASCQVFAYEAPTAIDQLRIDTYLMLRHLPEKITKQKGAGVLNFAVPDLNAFFENITEGDLSHRSRKQKVSPEIAVEAAFRSLDLVLFGKQSKSKVFRSDSNFVINDQDWGFEDASDEDIDNGIPLLIAYALDLASVTIESYSDHKGENRARFKSKIDAAKSKMQTTKDEDYKEHLDVALGVIKAELLYQKWRQDVVKKAAKNRQANLQKEKKVHNSLPEEIKARDTLDQAFWREVEIGTTPTSGGMGKRSNVHYKLIEGTFANVKWSDVDWQEGDYAYGMFEDYSGDSFVKDRLQSPIFNPKQNHRKNFEGVTYSASKFHFNLDFIAKQGLSIEDYDRNNKFSFFALPHSYVSSSNVDGAFLKYIYMNYANLCATLQSDYGKSNNKKFKSIFRVGYHPSIVDFLETGSKFYHENAKIKEFFDTFRLTQEESEELAENLLDKTSDKDLVHELYCFMRVKNIVPLTFFHLSNRLDMKSPSEENDLDYEYRYKDVFQKLHVGVSNLAEEFPTYFNPKYSSGFSGSYTVPPIVFLTNVLTGKIGNHTTNSPAVHMRAVKLANDFLYYADGDTRRLSITFDQMEEKAVENFLNETFTRLLKYRDRFDNKNEEYSLDLELISSDFANKISLEKIQGIVSKYRGLKINVESFANAYIFTIGFKDQA